jgi:hypothetical protein
LQRCCDNLQTCGIIDKVINIDFSEAYQKKVYVKHLGKFIGQTHNFRGAPVLGYIFLLEEADSDYLVHFNTDMLIYQNSSYNWIEEGIRTLSRYQEIVCVTPLSGPPTEDGSLRQNVPYDRDPRGFYRFRQFTSRKFLIDIKRFERLLPLRILWNIKKRHSDVPYPPPRTKDPFAAGKEIDRWENMISSRLRETPYFRVDLDTRSAWALHSSQNHDRDFIENLPHIIERIESGWYPPEQAGHYNLHLPPWLGTGE